MRVEETLGLRTGDEIGVPMVAFQLGGPFVILHRLGQSTAPKFDLHLAEILRAHDTAPISLDQVVALFLPGRDSRLRAAEALRRGDGDSEQLAGGELRR